MTSAILKRVLSYCADDFEIISELPARGGQVKSKIHEFNKLSLAFPVVLLTDLDANMCAPQLCNQFLPEGKNDHFIFNIAVDEAEAWLMADREGFADYFGIPIDSMPVSHLTKQGGRRELIEMDFSCKSSWYLTNELIRNSKKLELRQQLTPKKGASKGPEYNSCILPFVNNHWNIEQAMKHSDSLCRMIRRVQTLVQ